MSALIKTQNLGAPSDNFRTVTFVEGSNYLYLFYAFSQLTSQSPMGRVRGDQIYAPLTILCLPINVVIRGKTRDAGLNIRVSKFGFLNPNHVKIGDVTLYKYWDFQR